jgi:polar amino acid transport system substrate-binding protein
LTASGTNGAQTGFSIVAQLKQPGAKVDDSAPTADELLGRAASARYLATALQITEADNSRASLPALHAKVERVSPPLVEKACYTVFPKPFLPSMAKRPAKFGACKASCASRPSSRPRFHT